MQWTTCPPAPLAWFSLRELLLGLVHSPALLLPLAAALGLALAWWWQLSRAGATALALLLPLALSAIYSPPATALLSGWLQSQLPAAPSSAPAAVVVLLGRGPAIAAATTSSAAVQLRRDPSLPTYVSGDARSTAERLVQLGVPVLLITDPWQLPRASRAFARQGLKVHPLAAEPPLTAPERNRLALREAAASLLYRLQGRM